MSLSRQLIGDDGDDVIRRSTLPSLTGRAARAQLRSMVL
jgi:hypothetical protein